MVGPARREEGLWGRLSGELRVPRFRCGGDQKGWGEWQVNLFHWRFCTNIASHTHTLKHTEKIHPRSWQWLFLSFLQLGHDGATPESCWLVDELCVAVPTKGVKYIFACKCWLAKDRGDGLTARVFNVLDSEAISISHKVCKCRRYWKQSHVAGNIHTSWCYWVKLRQENNLHQESTK